MLKQVHVSKSCQDILFSPDGEMLASASHDETIKLWNVRTGVCYKTFQASRPYKGMNIARVRGLIPIHNSQFAMTLSTRRARDADSL
ncbi:MAG: hypothetical protein V7L29_34425 [Nostoc sp.]|uniref:WD40 repeat domain-containing protein n=1 Tax=Nostoc sp. TaxID=1180 RepID=UPI002FF3D96C